MYFEHSVKCTQTEVQTEMVKGFLDGLSTSCDVTTCHKPQTQSMTEARSHTGKCDDGAGCTYYVQGQEASSFNDLP